MMKIKLVPVSFTAHRSHNRTLKVKLQFHDVGQVIAKAATIKIKIRQICYSWLPISAC